MSTASKFITTKLGNLTEAARKFKTRVTNNDAKKKYANYKLRLSYKLNPMAKRSKNGFYYTKGTNNRVISSNSTKCLKRMGFHKMPQWETCPNNAVREANSEGGRRTRRHRRTRRR